MLKLISWNMGHVQEHWAALLSTGAHIALLQEACKPPDDVNRRIEAGTEPWVTGKTGRPWRACVVGLDGRVPVTHRTGGPLGDQKDGQLCVSLAGSLAVADVSDPDTGETLTVVSMYAAWERPLKTTNSDWIYADASAHRIVSDLSALIGHQRKHRIIASGDLNILNGYGEHRSEYWAERYRTVFDRFSALGLRFVGPQFPGGQRAEPPPEELPANSLNVPTFRTNRNQADSATRQLDFVFASDAIASQVRTTALNSPGDWGRSDHCMVTIDIDSSF